MYQFCIKCSIPELETMIARDCIQRRRAPGYVWRDFRAVIRLQIERDPVRWKKGKPPCFFMGDIRYFRYELIDHGDYTSVTGKFVLPLGSLLLPLLILGLQASFIWFHGGAKLLTNLFFLAIFLGVFVLWCLYYSLSFFFLPGKRIRDKLKREVLDYFAQLEREYPVP